MKKQRGITIVELVVTIIVIGIITAPLALVIAHALKNTAIPEYYTTASALAKREIERVTNQQFSAILDEGPTNYTGNFSAYSYQIAVVEAPADYKTITITIRKPGFSDVTVVTMATNN